jgi:MFS superfamily sulfate permease-like transporter
MVKYQDAIEYWRISKWDFAVWFLAFACTTLLGVTGGILISIAACVIQLLVQQALPAAAVLAGVPGTEVL